jgi:hypothetical protein
VADKAVADDVDPVLQASRSWIINATPWEPLPGMIKRQCPSCRFFFAANLDAAERRCPDCVIAETPRPDPADK